MKILLVDDDELLGNALSKALMGDRYLVDLATDGRLGLEMAQSYEYDLILLDILLPGIDGISLCRQLRTGGYQNPILLLTAKDSNTDKITGLDAGADDYMTKPVDLPELLARVRALLRRRGRSFSPVLSWGELQLHPETGEVHYRDHLLTLTPKEFRLLEMFLQHPQRVFSRSSILDRLWTLDEFPTESTVTTHIKDLRQRLRLAGAPDPIDTVYGLGYRLKPPPALTDGPGPAPHARKTPVAGSDQPRMVTIQKVLDRHRDSFETQVAVLEQAQNAWLTGTLSQDLRQQAIREAHKLAGSLGIFGMPMGSDMARQIEHLLMDETCQAPTNAKQLTQLVLALRQALDQPVPPLVPVDSITEPEAEASCPLVLLIESTDDSAPSPLAESLRVTAKNWDLRIQAVPSLEAARPAIARTPPALILLDLTSPDTIEAGLTLLAELTIQTPATPVLAFVSETNLVGRVRISRLGGQGVLHKTMPPDQILRLVAQHLPQPAATEARVMIVDDDPLILNRLESLLRPWGLVVITLQDPQRFWDVLTTEKPDLLVLDLEMPTFSGFDLCQVVRQDPCWGDLPILIFTAHTDLATVQQVFAAGADDFVGKPVVGPELVTRIVSRIERIQLQRQLEAARRRARGVVP